MDGTIDTYLLEPLFLSMHYTFHTLFFCQLYKSKDIWTQGLSTGLQYMQMDVFV